MRSEISVIASVSEHRGTAFVRPHGNSSTYSPARRVDQRKSHVQATSTATHTHTTTTTKSNVIVS